MQARAQEITRRHGNGALLPLPVGEDRLGFAPDEVEGMVVYVTAERPGVVIGGPSGTTVHTGRDRALVRDTR